MHLRLPAAAPHPPPKGTYDGNRGFGARKYDPPDLDAYFARIGYAGRRAPTLATLKAIQLHHTQAIPFENLDPILRRPVLLDLASLERKLLRDRRGGYCFEQNLVFSHVLKALGFHVTGLAARVLWNAPEGILKARTHMLLRIELEGASYLADMGFGVSTPTAPLRLEPDSVQSTPHESFRLLRAAGGFVMQARVHGLWKSLYAFDLQEQLQPDYEVVNWYLSNHPDSRFVNELMVARPAPGRRITLRNLEFTVHCIEGDSKRRSTRRGAELRAILDSVFDLTLREAPELDAALARLAGSK